MKIFQCGLKCEGEPIQFPEEKEVVVQGAMICAVLDGFLKKGEKFPEGSVFSLVLIPGLISMYTIIVEIPEPDDLKFNKLIEGVNLDGF